MVLILLLTLALVNAQTLNLTTCPVLDCNPEEPLEKGVCFEHDGRVPTIKLKGGLCFDIKKAPITALPYFCPFSLAEDEYAWVKEYLQVQIGAELNKKCKCCFRLDHISFLRV